MEEVGFVLTVIAWTGAIGFGLTEIAWNGKSQFWPLLERLGMEEVGFGLSRMAWNEGSQFWPAWNCMEWRKLIFT
jgi:hypothetical protein